MARTSTGTSLIPRERTLVSHSINLAFSRRTFAGFTVLWFLRGMEKWDGLRFWRSVLMRSDAPN
jgi:hypothetical protein